MQPPPSGCADPVSLTANIHPDRMNPVENQAFSISLTALSKNSS